MFNLYTTLPTVTKLDWVVLVERNSLQDHQHLAKNLLPAFGEDGFIATLSFALTHRVSPELPR